MMLFKFKFSPFDSPTAGFIEINMQKMNCVCYTFYLATQWTETILTPIVWAFFHVDMRPCLKTTWVTCLLSVFDTCNL